MNPLTFKLKTEFEKGRGVRIGETCCASKKVHVISPDKPEIVKVIKNQDAGMVFYGREKEGEVIHLDIFHEVKEVDVKSLAKDLIDHLKMVQKEEILNYIDIQTGTGGGRLTGSLEFGQTESLKKNHLNHVHLALMLKDEELNLLIDIVKGVEDHLQKNNVGLRKIEKIFSEVGNTPVDLSPYMSISDSFLKGEGKKGEYNRKNFENAVDLMEYLGSLKELEEILDSLSQKGENINFLKRKYSDFESILEKLYEKNFLEKKEGKIILNNNGEEFKKFIKENYKELELKLKKLIKNIKINRSGASSKKHREIHSKGVPLLTEINNKEWLEEIDIPETFKNAIVRSFHEKENFYIKKEDIVLNKRFGEKEQDICLIIDASASMNGSRLRSAKFLAKHILLNAKKRVAVLAFQDKEVKLFVPYTKNFTSLESGVSSIVSSGLTPLALAIEKGFEYMTAKKLKNPLMILITDGIPTVPLWTNDPLKDAIKAAEKLSRRKIDFFCIGLQPNKDCLSKISKAAKGKLYVVEELRKDALLYALLKSGKILK
ncbi:MAG: vWA domain-containing protein [Thermovenabulum sp.]|uniref:vWA domain-containing protein n=1 Tax=Thermovenabulum sp. TaxID=3100335 RepID=UPI003C7CAA8A